MCETGSPCCPHWQCLAVCVRVCVQKSVRETEEKVDRSMSTIWSRTFCNYKSSWRENLITICLLSCSVQNNPFFVCLDHLSESRALCWLKKWYLKPEIDRLILRPPRLAHTGCVGVCVCDGGGRRLCCAAQHSDSSVSSWSARLQRNGLPSLPPGCFLTESGAVRILVLADCVCVCEGKGGMHAVETQWL